MFAAIKMRAEGHAVFINFYQVALRSVIARSLNCLRRRSNLVVYDGIATIASLLAMTGFFPN